MVSVTTCFVTKTTPMYRKLRYVSKCNKLVQLVVQVKYHVNVIYSLGGRYTRARPHMCTHACAHTHTHTHNWFLDIRIYQLVTFVFEMWCTCSISKPCLNHSWPGSKLYFLSHSGVTSANFSIYKGFHWEVIRVQLVTSTLQLWSH